MKRIRYRVTAKVKNVQIAEKFVQWMSEEHGEDLLNTPGCLEYRVFEAGPLTLTCEYLFESKEALKNYYEKFAPALRKKGNDKFSEGEVEFTRDENSLIVEGYNVK